MTPPTAAAAHQRKLRTPSSTFPHLAPRLRHSPKTAVSLPCSYKSQEPRNGHPQISPRMCTSLNDLFSCLRPQVNIESDATPYQGNEDVVPGTNHARRNALKLKQQQRSSKGVAPAAPGSSSATAGVLKQSGCIRPSSRDSRVSYEAMERYDQIFGGPAGPEPSLSRNIPDQF